MLLIAGTAAATFSLYDADELTRVIDGADQQAFPRAEAVPLPVARSVPGAADGTASGSAGDREPDTQEVVDVGAMQRQRLIVLPPFLGDESVAGEYVTYQARITWTTPIAPSFSSFSNNRASK